MCVSQICQVISEVSSANQELLRKYKREMNLRKKCHNELVRLKGPSAFTGLLTNTAYLFFALNATSSPSGEGRRPGSKMESRAALSSLVRLP